VLLWRRRFRLRLRQQPLAGCGPIIPPAKALWGRLPTCGPIVNRSIRAQPGHVHSISRGVNGQLDQRLRPAFVRQIFATQWWLSEPGRKEQSSMNVFAPKRVVHFYRFGTAVRCHPGEALCQSLSFRSLFIERDWSFTS